MASSQTPGGQIREWRARRRMSQLDLALAAGVSQRHLSFVESGRSRPSRELVLNLGRELAIPPREQNVILNAAGFAPVFNKRRLDDPALDTVRLAVERVLAAHEPFPALAVDRAWSLVTANRTALALVSALASPRLLEPPVNVLRLSLHPDGFAPRILNVREWKQHVLARLRGQIEVSYDRELVALHDELSAWPVPASDTRPSDPNDVYVPLQLSTPAGVLSLISTTTVFGTPVDVTVSELAIEAFFPADGSDPTAVEWLKDLASS
ncbi:helix-turn-helix transcriptional regulator [Hoeflea sp. WL0058]|uniref:Helix-turn-helix transcriptional regulator n=1 Tax=Flavimaribacter sediminis TaxID=2865987 RepID=A0AAE2ZNS3_9HYPH|nr:helix-turn-helix transcriptional regulator [Flavimaribacter sediminis]MBW8638145.1 helix-turn-helix transcriptional regulator [Flavimaribacter sediminis]